VNVFVVAAYDEEANLPRLLNVLEARPGLWAGGRVIVVDDGSSDATAAVAGRHPGELPVEVISLGTNQGPGRAFDRGFRRALELAPEEGFGVTLEADSTSDLDALGGTLALAQERADVVLASTHAPGGGLEKASILRRGYERHGDALVRERGFACKAELLFKLSRRGVRLEEVPVAIDWSAREGESKMRVLPTVVAYLRLMTRQAFARRGEAAA
jgi:dolichol-phosphate mannosyltransferase